MSIENTNIFTAGAASGRHHVYLHHCDGLYRAPAHAGPSVSRTTTAKLQKSQSDRISCSYQLAQSCGKCLLQESEDLDYISEILTLQQSSSSSSSRFDPETQPFFVNATHYGASLSETLPHLLVRLPSLKKCSEVDLRCTSHLTSWRGEMF